MATLSWQLDYSRSRAAGAAQWLLPAAVAGELEGAVRALLREDAEGGAFVEELPAARVAAAAAAARGRHAVRLHLPGRLCVKLVLRKVGSAQVRWESPLAALQRAEGIVLLHTPRVDDTVAYRVSPPDVQALVARVVRAAATAGTPLGAGRTLVPGVAATDLHAVAARDLGQYEGLAAALVAQRDRASAGGEAWSTPEKLRKLASLQTLAMSVSHKVEHGARLTDEEASVLEALAAGRAELEADAERERVGGAIGTDARLAEVAAQLGLAPPSASKGHAHRHHHHGHHGHEHAHGSRGGHGHAHDDHSAHGHGDDDVGGAGH